MAGRRLRSDAVATVVVGFGTGLTVATGATVAAVATVDGATSGVVAGGGTTVVDATVVGTYPDPARSTSSPSTVSASTAATKGTTATSASRVRRRGRRGGPLPNAGILALLTLMWTAGVRILL